MKQAVATPKISDDLLERLKEAMSPSSASLPTTTQPAQQETWASVYGFLLPRDEQIATLLLQGKSRFAAAREVGIHPQTVYKLVQTDTFQTAFHTMQAELRETMRERKDRIEQLATLALDNVAGVLVDCQDKELQVRTSLGMIDRAGHSIKQQAVVEHRFEIDPETGALIAAAMDELRAAQAKAGDIVEVRPVNEVSKHGHVDE